MSEDAFLEHAVRASLVDLLDKRVIAVLRDGRKLLGDLRSFDQYGNVVLEAVAERDMAGAKYADRPVGTVLLRGENLVLIGEIDREREAAANADGTLVETDAAVVAMLAGEERVRREAERRRLMDLRNEAVADDAFDPLV